MKKLLFSKILIFAFIIGVSYSANAQKNVGIGTDTPDPSAVLDLNVSDGTLFPTKMGFLVPRMTASDRNAIVSPANGLLVYVTDTEPGFYLFNGTQWVKISMAGDPVNGTASGDLSGNFPNPTVSALRGRNISTATPTNGQALIWNGTDWTPTDVPAGTVTSVALTLPAMFSITGSPITNNGTFDVTLASQTAKSFLAAPTDADGIPTFRQITLQDLDFNAISTGANVTNGIATYLDSATLQSSANFIYNPSGDVILTNGNIDLATIAGGTAKSIRLYEGNAGGNYIAIKSPEAVDADLTYTLPSTLPTTLNNNYLVTDLSGNLSWTSAAGLPVGTLGQTLYNDGTSWASSDLITNSGTKVGINTPDLTSTPDSVVLDITNDVRITGDLIVTGNIDPVSITLIPQTIAPTTTQVGTIYFDNATNNLNVYGNNSQWNTIAYGQTESNGVPSGAIMQFAGTTAPTGWLICDGSAVSRTTYASLFATIGTSYGAGDGSSTFNLPDLSGKFPLGSNATNPLGQTGGNASFVLDSANMPTHNHRFVGTLAPRFSDPKQYDNSGNENATFFLTNTGNNGEPTTYDYTGADDERLLRGSTIRPAGGSSQLTIPTLPPYVVTNYIIKL